MNEVFVVTSEIATDDGLKYKVEGVKSTHKLAKELWEIVNRNRRVRAVEIECFQVDEEY